MSARVYIFLLATLFVNCRKANEYRATMKLNDSTRMSAQMGNPINPNVSGQHNLDTATFGLGCFWCSEALFQNVNGILEVETGYSGGNDTTFVDLEKSGHAEVLQIVFDPARLKYQRLLEMFWGSHDPTTLNRQGDDIGRQYRSAIFYHNDSQRQIAADYLSKLTREKVWDIPIVTEITRYQFFIPAADNDQNYFLKNPTKQYCTQVIQPKLEAFKKAFTEEIQ